MPEESSMARLCEAYIRRAGVIGLLYCAVPVVVGYAIEFASAPFRSVYVLRLILSLVLGGALGAFLNRFGLSLWLAKHKSSNGPATVADGLLIGAGVGFGTTVIPLLTILIATHHPEQAKTFIICAWLIAMAVGAIIGAGLAVIGREHVKRPG